MPRPGLRVNNDAFPRDAAENHFDTVRFKESGGWDRTDDITAPTDTEYERAVFVERVFNTLHIVLSLLHSKKRVVTNENPPVYETGNPRVEGTSEQLTSMTSHSLSDVTGLVSGDRVEVVVEGERITGQVGESAFDPPVSPVLIVDSDVPLPGYFHASIETDDDERLRLRQMSNPDGELTDLITLERADSEDQPPLTPHAWEEVGVVEELSLVSGL